MARRPGITAKNEEAFLAQLSKTGNVTKSARSVGIPKQRFYELKKKDLNFSKRWEEAEYRREGKVLIDEVVRRATKRNKPSDILFIMCLSQGGNKSFKRLGFEERPNQSVTVRWARTEQEVNEHS